MYFRIVTAALVLGTAALSAQNVAAQDNGQTRVSASVPVVCSFAASDLKIQGAGESASGYAFEACNSARGFVISATTRLLEDDEQLTLFYANSAMALRRDGVTPVLRHQGASARRVPLRVESMSLHAPVTLSLSMSAV